MQKVIVIGGGASGLIAAISAARKGASVTVLEAMKKPGTKLLRTGNGKCNYTHIGSSSEVYRGEDPSFSQEVLMEFSVDDTISFFRDLGIFPYVREGWVYPHSEQASSVLTALVDELARLRVKIKTQEMAVQVLRDPKRKELPFTVCTKTWQYSADAVIVSTGSPASLSEIFPGPELVSSFSLKGKAFHPALTYLVTSEKKMTHMWAGVRARACAALYREGDKRTRLWHESGQIQFTPKGISGIPVFNMSSLASDELLRKMKLCVELDLVPDAEEGTLSDFLMAEQMHSQKKNAHDLIRGIIPDKLIPCVVPDAGDDPLKIAHKLKHFEVPVTGTGPLNASQCAGGGISTNEIDPHTLMVRLVPGLFITGELLDIDAVCGGWNLQFAWSTGFLAGRAAAVPYSF